MDAGAKQTPRGAPAQPDHIPKPIGQDDSELCPARLISRIMEIIVRSGGK